MTCCLSWIIDAKWGFFPFWNWLLHDTFEWGLFNLFFFSRGNILSWWLYCCLLSWGHVGHIWLDLQSWQYLGLLTILAFNACARVGYILSMRDWGWSKLVYFSRNPVYNCQVGRISSSDVCLIVDEIAVDQLTLCWNPLEFLAGISLLQCYTSLFHCCRYSQLLDVILPF